MRHGALCRAASGPGRGRLWHGGHVAPVLRGLPTLRRRVILVLHGWLGTLRSDLLTGVERPRRGGRSCLREGGRCRLWLQRRRGRLREGGGARLRRRRRGRLRFRSARRGPGRGSTGSSSVRWLLRGPQQLDERVEGGAVVVVVLLLDLDLLLDVVGPLVEEGLHGDAPDVGDAAAARLALLGRQRLPAPSRLLLALQGGLELPAPARARPLRRAGPRILAGGAHGEGCGGVGEGSAASSVAPPRHGRGGR
mmetsp:Transcript_23776/g.70974  ORF Transcript_23776/g.70974 Transcript_23776/m.70974 type:complete len:251 (-) Transcript_23776:37-789(-)